MTFRHRAIAGALAALLLAAAPATTVAEPPAAAPSTRLFTDSRIVAGDRISVEVVGQGPDLIFIPGLASSRDTWRATAQRLRGRYRLHLIQVAGFAGEPAGANATGPVLAPTAEAIDAYIVSARLSPAVVIGHSMGGTMALYLAEHHPDHLKKVMLVDALPAFAAAMLGPQATADQARAIGERIRANPAPAGGGGGAAMMARMATAQADKDRIGGWSKVSDPSAVANAMADDLELDLSPGLAAIRTPVTVLYPDYVAAGMPPGMADTVYGGVFAAMPGKTLKRVDGSLHFIMFDQPAVFAADLDAFLAQ
jgi:pimeloyl-[acyl-carrier protein] methyl ester esterase